MSSLETYETVISSQGSKLSVEQERAILGLPESDPDPDFIPKFFVSFNGPPPNIADLSVTDLIPHLLNPSSESSMYSKVTELFNEITQFLAASGHKSCQIPLVFHPMPKQGPASQRKSRYGNIKPDVVVLPPEDDSVQFANTESTESTRFPWPILLAPFEVKVEINWAKRQICQYLQTVLEHRPDAINVLGMSCNKGGFRFYYADACVQLTSNVFSWEEGLDKLVHFTYTLHERYAKDIGRDKTMELINVEWNGIHATPSWKTVYDGKSYTVQPIFQYRGRGRRTWIAIGIVEPKAKGALRVIKDLWRDNSRRYEESDLLSRIHQNGFIPGIVRSVTGGSLALSLTTGDRTKHRLVMGSTGLRLSACKSVLEFLKVIYDAIEAHESAMAQGVLHRDISWYNVLCHPKHYIGEDKVIDRPNIGKVLGDPDSRPLCLLTDFDNAALIDDSKDPKEGTERTGTPMFMACELAYSKDAYQDHFEDGPISITPLQFALEGDVLQKHVDVYGQDRYTKFNDFLTSVLSGGLEEVDPYGDNHFPPHKAHHDMESMFWIIALFLAKALPTGRDPYPIGKGQQSQEWLTTSLYSRRTLNHNSVPIIMILQNLHGWHRSLHPAFKPLAKMLSDMTQYLCMQWSKFRDLRFCWWHSHEAFKRLLLKEIVRMSGPDGDPMPVQGPRPPLSDATETISPAISKSRTSNTGPSLHVTPSSSAQSSSRDGRSSSQSENPSIKRGRLDSSSSNVGNAAKKLRPATPLASSRSLVKLCVENIDDDYKWFNEP